MRAARWAAATRPWSLTAGAVPVLVATGALDGWHATGTVAGLLALAALVQIAANVANSLCDSWRGVDAGEGAGDPTLVKGVVSEREAMAIALAAALGAVGVLLLWLPDSAELRALAAAGALLAVFYTAPPLSFKYRGLGDAVTMLCFGPLLMEACALALTGSTSARLLLFAVPVSLSVELILLGNNARDIESDRAAGIFTVCIALGFERSRMLHLGLLGGLYTSLFALAWAERSALFLVGLATAPLARTLHGQFRPKQMREAPERAAKLHLVQGALLALSAALRS